MKSKYLYKKPSIKTRPKVWQVLPDSSPARRIGLNSQGNYLMKNVRL